MCGRYVLSSPGEAIAEHFRLGAVPVLAPRYNIAPTQPAAVIRESAGGGRELALLRWGLVPGWAKGADIGNRLINARAETVAVKPAFRAAYRNRRCLVPADGFYEWKPAGRRKQPFFCHLRGGGLLAMAGLWEAWRAPDGGTVETFTIITTDANADMAPIHQRMPAILMPGDYDTWLRASDPAALLAPPRGGTLAAVPVSTRVNHVGNDEPALVEAVEAGNGGDV